TTLVIRAHTALPFPYFIMYLLVTTTLLFTLNPKAGRLQEISQRDGLRRAFIPYGGLRFGCSGRRGGVRPRSEPETGRRTDAAREACSDPRYGVVPRQSARPCLQSGAERLARAKPFLPAALCSCGSPSLR